MLKRMIVAESFDRQNFGAFDLREWNEARAHGLSVDENRARAAFSLATSFLGSGKKEVFAQHIEQASGRVYIEIDW